MRISPALFSLCLGLILLAACKGDSTDKDPKVLEPKAELAESIQGYEKKLVGQVTVDRNLADSVIRQQLRFVEQYPDDPATPNYMFRAADISRGIGEFARAIELWEKLREKHPDFKQAPDALFMIAFTFDGDLHDKINAKKTYEQVIREYPQHPLAEQSKSLIPLLDKDNDEIIREFERKNAADSLQ